MKNRKIFSLALALSLSIQLIVMPAAIAAEDPSTPRENPDGSLTIVKEYPSTDTAPSLPETITQGGLDYTLDTTQTALAEGFVPPRQAYVRNAFSEVPLSGINNLGAYFPATYPIDDGVYKGEISLDPITPFTVVERYEVYRVQVDKTTEFYDLPDNDVSRLPVYQTFTVSSSVYPGATTTATLQIVDVTYTVVGTDHLGLPNNYTAFATYRGQEEYAQLHHYDVTANYSGELLSSEEQLALTGLYQPVPVVEEDPIEIVEEDVPLAEPQVPLAQIGLVIAAAAAAGGVVYLMALLLRPFKVRHRDEQTGKVRTVQRRRIKRDQAIYVVAVKPSVSLSYDKNMFGTLPTRYQDKGLQIKVLQNSIEVYEGDVLPEMPLINEITTYDEYVLQEDGVS